MLGLSFIPVNMHQLPNSMKIMVLNCQKELFVCIVRNFKFAEACGFQMEKLTEKACMEGHLCVCDNRR